MRRQWEARSSLISRSVRGREREAEPAALARCALHADLATVRVDDAAHYREPQASAALAAFTMLLPKTIEHVGEVRCSNPYPGVLHGKANSRRIELGPKGDVASPFGKLQGIRQQVGKPLDYPLGVGADRRQVGCCLSLQDHATLPRRGGEQVRRLRQQIAWS